MFIIYVRYVHIKIGIQIVHIPRAPQGAGVKSTHGHGTRARTLEGWRSYANN